MNSQFRSVAKEESVQTQMRLQQQQQQQNTFAMQFIALVAQKKILKTECE